MSRSQPPGFSLNIDICDQPNRVFRSRSGAFTSLLHPARMLDHPTRSMTVSPATPVSGSSAPSTPSRGLGLSNLPFPSSLVDSYNNSPTTFSHRANSMSDWSLPTSICENMYIGSSRVDLPPTTLQLVTSGALEATAFYSSAATLPSSSMPMSSASIDSALAQLPNPVLLNGNFPWEVCPTIKREEVGESWFDDHIDMERSQSSIDFSSYGSLDCADVPSSHIAYAGLVSSPSLSHAALSPGSSQSCQKLESSPTTRSESVESCTALETLVSNGMLVQDRRHSANGERRYTCSVCKRAFDKKYNLREHEKKHDPNRVSQFPCPASGCGKRLGRKTDVNRHFQSVHEKAKRFVCTKCSKRFDRKDTLSR